LVQWSIPSSGTHYLSFTPKKRSTEIPKIMERKNVSERKDKKRESAFEYSARWIWRWEWTNRKDTHVNKCPMVTNVQSWYRHDKMSNQNLSTNVDLRERSGKMPKHIKRRRNSRKTRAQNLEDHVERLKIAVKRQEQNICNPARPAKEV
jgi:hypothetical protein